MVLKLMGYSSRWDKKRNIRIRAVISDIFN